VNDLAKAHANLVADLLGVGGGDVLGEITDLTERTISLLRSVAILHECTPRSLDAIVSYGEKISAPIVAAQPALPAVAQIVRSSSEAPSRWKKRRSIELYCTRPIVPAYSFTASPRSSSPGSSADDDRGQCVRPAL